MDWLLAGVPSPAHGGSGGELPGPLCLPIHPGDLCLPHLPHLHLRDLLQADQGGCV